MDPAKAPIFVVGTGRSGTTLLRLMLSAHPRIYITHEAHFYFWERLLYKTTPRAYLEQYFQTAAFRFLSVDPDRVLAGLPDPLPRGRLGEAYAAIMREKAAQYGRVRYGDKTPLHSGHLARIFDDFPDARVIHIVRDPRGAALSLSQMPWACKSLYANAIYCEMDRVQVQKFRGRVLRVRLEDLLDDARGTMGRVLEFAGEPWDEAVLDHARHAPRGDMPPLGWLESSTGSRRGADAGRQWAALQPATLRMVERVARGTMTESGYAKAELEHEPSRLEVLWEQVRQVPEMLRFLGVWYGIYRRMRDPLFTDTETFDGLFRRINPGAWSRYPELAERLPKPPRLRSRVAGDASAGTS